MKISGVYISLGEQVDCSLRSQYQCLSSYLTLFISDWLKRLELDLGVFNRIIFEEGDEDDMSLAGDGAFVVCLRQEFKGVDDFRNAQDVHEYFVRKYLEGFNRFDEQFGLNLSDKLRLLVAEVFSGNLVYEIDVKCKRIDSEVVKVVHRYRCDGYELLVRVLGVEGEVIKENVIFNCDPDPFIVHYDVNRIEIDTASVRVVNKVRAETVLFEL